MRRLNLVLVLLLIATATFAAGAEGLQKWKTGDGRVVYGNSPPGGAEIIETYEESPVGESPSGRGRAELSVSSSAGGKLTIDRVWAEPTSGFGYALVTYRNVSDRTYTRGVTIQCIALDSSGRKINENKRSFFAHEYGPIRPGFEGTLKVPVDLVGESLSSMQCNVREDP